MPTTQVEPQAHRKQEGSRLNIRAIGCSDSASSLSWPVIASYGRDESLERLRIAKYVEVRVISVFGDRFHEERAALAPIPQQPEPEIGTLARSPDCSPSASD